MNADVVQQAACRGEDPEMFFDTRRIKAAKRLCNVCPVRGTCLDEALNAETMAYLGNLASDDDRPVGKPEVWGVYGGWSATERTAVILRRAQQMIRRVPA